MIVSKGKPNQLVCCHCLHVFSDTPRTPRRIGDKIRCPDCGELNHVLDLEEGYIFLTNKPPQQAGGDSDGKR